MRRIATADRRLGDARRRHCREQRNGGLEDGELSAGRRSGSCRAGSARRTRRTPAPAQLHAWAGDARHHDRPVFWGSSWSDAVVDGDKVSGLDYVYSHVGGTPYLHTNSEYSDGAGNVNTTSVSKGRRT